MHSAQRQSVSLAWFARKGCDASSASDSAVPVLEGAGEASACRPRGINHAIMGDRIQV